jgi:hypothetical protein
MRFKRFLAIILLLILPLQSTLAAIDSCCNVASNSAVQGAVKLSSDAHDVASAAQVVAQDDCCDTCDFCNHAVSTYLTAPNQLRLTVLRSAPAPHHEPPIDSFIPDVPSRPDRG